LRKIEELKTRNITGINFTNAIEKTIQENLKSIPSVENSTTSPKSLRHMRKKRDVASHFILRAAYCKTEDLRRWFLSQETFLFKYQLEKIVDSSGGSQLLNKFLEENELRFEIVSDEEKMNLKPFLVQIPVFKSGTGAGVSGNNNGVDPLSIKVLSMTEVSNTTYFKIHFSLAADLIAKRHCYVHKGYAYVPLPKIVSIITAKFRTNLSKSLAKASRVFSNVTSEYAPVAPLLNTINTQYMGKDYNGRKNEIKGDYELNADNVDTYAASMPLCMSQLHKGLKQDSKLRHHARLQYGLFLKGAGMSMEESLIFFQRHFTKIMSSDKFQKEYAYNIRYNYGKEGKRANYNAYNCNKIIMGQAPSSGEHHGCPYKHYDNDHLASLLNKLQIGTSGDRDAIMSHKMKGNFTIACQTHFKAVHPNYNQVDLNGVGDHPNAWYAASVAYNKLKNGDTQDEGKKDTLKK
jgi:DNA primase large subunit